MVKKLIKHEFIYYIRTVGIFLPIILAIGAMTRVFRFFDNGNIINTMAIGSSVVLLVVACIALLMISTIFGVVRFYKNMYSSEGYLTFTLPVTNTEHMFVKLLMAMACQTVCVLTVIAAASIALSGKLFGDVFNVIVNLIDMMFLTCGTANSIGLIVEVILLLVISAVSNMILYYACITIGQTAKKNRIFAAVGVYFIYYVATQIISTAFTMIFTVLGMTGALNGVMRWFETSPVAALHTMFCAMIVISVAITVALWLVTKNIMTKKLNLE